MKLIFIVMTALNIVLLTRSASEKSNFFETIQNPAYTSRTVRQVPPKPVKICDSSTEGNIEYNVANPSSIWICKNSTWISFKLQVTLGSSKQLSAESCRQVRIQYPTDYELSAKSGLFWVKGMPVYCEMSNAFDGGGWTLVWQHSYMEDLPLNTNMTFFSDYYKPCNRHATSWCNIPNKARFNPTEQMIAAYLSKQIIYAYKGVFNRNIDYDWTGGYLMAYTRITDKCHHHHGYLYPPNPAQSFPGIGFGKRSASCGYHNGGGTITGTLTNPSNDRWHYCRDLHQATDEQMTIAIYVR